MKGVNLGAVTAGLAGGFLATGALALHQPPAQTSSTRAALWAVADRFDRAQLEGDRAVLEALTDADLVFVGSDGTRTDRAAFIRGWLSPGVRFAPAVVTDRYMVMLGDDAAIIGGEVTLRGSANGVAFSSRIRFADTFRMSGGEWRAVHIQATRIP